MSKLIPEATQLLLGNINSRLSNIPLTGDYIPWTLIIILALSAIAALVFFLTKKKKDNNTEDDI